MSSKNDKAEAARANTRQIIEQGPKVLVGLFAISGLAYLTGSVYTRSYFAEFGASWILDEVPTAIYFSQSWIPLLLILFFGYLATTNLGLIESQGNLTETKRFKVSVAVVQYGPWLLVGFLIMIPLLSRLGSEISTIGLSIAAIALLLLVFASALELLIVRFTKADRRIDLTLTYLALAVIAVGLYVVPMQLGMSWARVDKQTSSNLFKVYLRDDESKEYRILFAAGEKLYIFPSKYEGKYPLVVATMASNVTFVLPEGKSD